MPILPIYPPEHVPELVNDIGEDSSLDEDKWDGDAAPPNVETPTPQFGALYWLTRAQELMESISRDCYAFDDDLTPTGLPIILEEEDDGELSQDSWDEETVGDDSDCTITPDEGCSPPALDDGSFYPHTGFPDGYIDHPVRKGLAAILEVDEGLEADIVGNGTEAVILIVTAPSTDSVHTLASVPFCEDQTQAPNYFTGLPCTLTRKPRVLKRKAKPQPKPFMVFVDNTSNIFQTHATPKTVKKESVRKEGKENLS
jgi:hypothetical protein